MTSDRFFIKQSHVRSSTIILSGEEHHHLSKVARVKPKERVWLFDEYGMSYLTRVDDIDKDMTHLSVLEKRQKNEPRVKITFAQALLKAKKMELILQKSTELGVMTFIPVVAARSIVKIEEKIEKKMERWKRITLAAAKQCGRSVLPEVLTPLPLIKLLRERREEKRLFLDEKGGKCLRDIFLFASRAGSRNEFPPSSVIVLNGPEGGWSDEERREMLGSGYEPINLGRQILRAETAAISSMAMMAHFWNS